MINGTALTLGLAVGTAGALIGLWWFGGHKRRQMEVAAGIQALSGMKWRECAGLVIESLAGQGYSEEVSSRQPGDGGTEFLLRKGDESVLLSYKHGSAYRLGDSNIREFANSIQLCGAERGILMTLGSIEGVARELSGRYQIKLMDGSSVWPLVEKLVPQSLRSSIKDSAWEKNRIGLFASVACSIAVGLILTLMTAGQVGDAPATTGTVPEQSLAHEATGTLPTDTEAPSKVISPSSPATPVLDNANRANAQINASLRAMAEVAKLGAAELAKRRADVAIKVATIAQVRAASWSTQSTLVLSLAQSDGKDVALVTEVCEILARYEELRYMRLQLEPPPGTDYVVRWRMCQ